MKVWNAWNTVPTVQSTKDNNNFLLDKVQVILTNLSYTIDVYDTPLGRRWLSALADNLQKGRILEKNFCFLVFADSKRDLRYLCSELNRSVQKINSFDFVPAYQTLRTFQPNDFQRGAELGVGRESEGDFPGLTLKHDSCNLLHRYFEDLQGTAWKLSPFYLQADTDVKYAIRQLNNICHEIEGWVESYRKNIVDTEWMRASQITTFLNAPRYNLHQSDMELFKANRYRRELGGVYLHWSQVGKTLFEVFRDEGAKKLDAVTCSSINHQRFYSGEFDVEWGKTIDEETFEWKKKEMNHFRSWLDMNDYDWNDPDLALGYAKIGQVDMSAFGDDAGVIDVHNLLNGNLDIQGIRIISDTVVEQMYPYTLDSEDWQDLQKKALQPGYKNNNQ